MKINRLGLKRFRNIENCSFEPDPHINVLVGKNGQGKTSVLEGIGYLAHLRSFRSANTDELIQWQQPDSEVLASIQKSDWQTELKVLFQQQQNKTSKVAFINGKSFKSSSAYLNQRFGAVELGFHAVTFNPSDHDLIRGEPSTRRNYLDRAIAAEDYEFLSAIQKYKRIITQRNAILKSSDSPSRGLLEGFTEPMVTMGALIARKRLEWICRVSKPLSGTIRKIAPHQPSLRMICLSNWIPQDSNFIFPNNKLSNVHFTGQEQLPSLKLLEHAFWTRLLSVEKLEHKLRTSLVGPHRDDWTFLIGNEVLKGHGSQGEVRSALLALKLSEIQLFQEQTGHQPLLLLDDFSSELDRDRRGFLLQYLLNTDLQVFVTATEESLAFGKRFHVENGRVSESSMN